MKKYTWGALIAPQRGSDPQIIETLRSVARCEASEIDSVCCLDDEVTRTQARRFHCAPCQSYEDIITKEDLDVVYIATETAIRASLIRACLNYRKTVLVEPPLTCLVGETREIYDRAKKEGILLLEAASLCFLPSIRKLVELVRAQDIGAVLSLYAFSGIKQDVAREAEQNIFLNHGCLPLVLTSLLLGAPTKAWGGCTQNARKIPTQYALTLSHEGGAFSSLAASSLMDGGNEVIINGVKKRVQVGHPFYGRSVITLFEKQKKVGFLDFSYKESLRDYAVEELHTCLRNKKRESALWGSRHSVAFARSVQMGIKAANTTE